MTGFNRFETPIQRKKSLRGDHLFPGRTQLDRRAICLTCRHLPPEVYPSTEAAPGEPYVCGMGRPLVPRTGAPWISSCAAYGREPGSDDQEPSLAPPRAGRATS